MIYTDIIDKEIEIIRKSILANNPRTWVKSYVNSFELPMGAYDSAQVADLVRIHI